MSTLRSRDRLCLVQRHLMIQISALQKSYGLRTLFDGVTFTVARGERIGLVGRNGHGKTTLFRLITGEERADGGVVSVPAGYRIGHLSQHLRFEHATVLAEACANLPPSDDFRDDTYKAETVLLGLGFAPRDLSARPDMLSGGFQVRLNLARVLLAAPDLLLLDEPTNYLDILSLRWLERFLRGWKNELMLITHDRYFMDSVTTHTLVIHRCQVRKFDGGTEKAYEQIAQDEAVYEKTRLNDEKKRRQAEEFIERFRAKATKARAVQSRIKALERRERLEKLDDIDTLDFTFRSAPFPAKWPLSAEDLSFSYSHDGPNLIDHFSIAVGTQDRIGIIGRNGRGKTTLLNLLAGDLPAKGGVLKHHEHLRLAAFGQTNIDRLSPDKTVLQEILDTHPDVTHQIARSIAGAMMFEGDDALKKVRVLSGGERSRVLLAKLLVRPANVLLLDEPTNHLDMESVDSLIEAIAHFEGAVIIVTHSEMVLNAVATRLVVFDGGGVRTHEGTYREFLERQGWQEERQSDAGTSPADRKTSRKDLRRLRAEIISERSRLLSPFQKRMTETEASIIAAEEQVKLDTQALLEASASGDASSIRKLSKAVHDGNLRIEDLFSKLEEITTEHDAHAQDFARRLSEIAADDDRV